jgi:hypothetical protein
MWHEARRPRTRYASVYNPIWDPQITHTIPVVLADKEESTSLLANWSLHKAKVREGGTPVLTTEDGLELPSCAGEDDRRLHDESDNHLVTGTKLPELPVTTGTEVPESTSSEGVQKNAPSNTVDEETTAKPEQLLKGTHGPTAAPQDWSEQLEPPKTDNDEELPDFSAEDEPAVPQETAHMVNPVEMAGYGNQNDGSFQVLLDTGCSSTGLMTVDVAETAADSCSRIDAGRRRRYGFADGNGATSSSTALFATRLGNVPFDIVERPGRTCLLGMGWLRAHEAQVCLATNVMKYKDNNGQWTELQWNQAANGHLALSSESFFLATAASAETEPDQRNSSEVAATSDIRNIGSETVSE